MHQSMTTAMPGNEFLSMRVSTVRRELFGEFGGPDLARALGLSFAVWMRYEDGGSIPGTVILRFIDVTHVEVDWLLHGRGPCYRSRLGGLEGG